MRHGPPCFGSQRKEFLLLQQHSLDTESSSVGMLMAYPWQQIGYYVILKTYVLGTIAIIESKGHSAPLLCRRNRAENCAARLGAWWGTDQRKIHLTFFFLLLLLSFILFKNSSIYCAYSMGISAWLSSWDSTLRSQV